MEEGPAKTMDMETLSNMSRKEVQVLAKEHGVKANLKTEEIIESILRKIENGCSATPCNSNPVSPAPNHSITKPRSGRSARSSQAPSSTKAPRVSARKLNSAQIDAIDESSVAEDSSSLDQVGTEVIENKLDFGESLAFRIDEKDQSPVSIKISSSSRSNSKSRSARKNRKSAPSPGTVTSSVRRISGLQALDSNIGPDPTDESNESTEDSSSQTSSIAKGRDEAVTPHVSENPAMDVGDSATSPNHDPVNTRIASDINADPQIDAPASSQRRNSARASKSRLSLAEEQTFELPASSSEQPGDAHTPAPQHRRSRSSVGASLPLDPTASSQAAGPASAKKARLSLRASVGPTSVDVTGAAPADLASPPSVASAEAQTLPGPASDEPVQPVAISPAGETAVPRRSSRSSSTTAATAASTAKRPVSAPPSRTAAQPRRSTVAAAARPVVKKAGGEKPAPGVKRAPPPDFDRMHRLAFARMPSIKDKAPPAPRAAPPPPPPSAARAKATAPRTATAPPSGKRAADAAAAAPAPKRTRTSGDSATSSVAPPAVAATGVAALGVRDPQRTGYRAPAPFVVLKSTQGLTAAAPFNFSQPRPKTARAGGPPPLPPRGEENRAPASGRSGGGGGGGGARASLVLDRVSFKVPSAGLRPRPRQDRQALHRPRAASPRRGLVSSGGGGGGSSGGSAPQYLSAVNQPGGARAPPEDSA
jgi:hypothetical protein